MSSSHLILCRPLLLLPPIPPSIRVFSNESTLRMRWPKYWSFSFNISPSNEHPGLISFTMDGLDLLAVQGTFKSLPTYINSNMINIEKFSESQHVTHTITFEDDIMEIIMGRYCHCCYWKVDWLHPPSVSMTQSLHLWVW